MSFDHRSRLSVLSLLCLTSLGLPGPAGAEEGFPPLRPVGAPPIEARALEPPQGETSFASAAESALQSQAPDPTQPGLDANLYSSDEPRAWSFSEPGLQNAPPTLLIRDNAEVRRFLEEYQTGYRRALVERWLGRSGRYAEMIQGVLRSKGLPEDLMFTAMIESGFNPVAVSRAGAKGLWQFMAPTARRYGLRVDRWVDERLDPEKSTVAAASYLRDLHAMFGSWELAKAAYNAGEMKVIRAMKALKTRDFWDLTRGSVLREETKNFVPAIQAATLIGREPERYGFVAAFAEPLAYEQAPVPAVTTLKHVAALAGVSADELEELNSELRLKQTPPGGAYLLKFPSGGAQRFTEARLRGRGLASHGRPGVSDIHVVKPRETMRGIARRYGLSAAELARRNDLNEAARIRPGDRLRIAAASPLD
ncbi:MAG: lytic transglycosylase [Candidatus Rokuibacteriota bacterium]|nr:MAG: lytic transglycosylase [Candidatus Rokubacteria bacterium]